MIVLLLFVAAVILIYLELFLPGAIFGTIGLIALIASIFFAFYYYQAMGFWILVAELAVAASFLLIGLKRFPHSYAGKLLILKRNLDKRSGYSGTESLEQYMGKTGVTLTHLRPAGIASVDSVRLDVVTEGAYIEKGKHIRVVEVTGNRVVVREIAAATSNMGG